LFFNKKYKKGPFKNLACSPSNDASHDVKLGERSNEERYKVPKISQNDTKEVEVDPLLPIHPFLSIFVGPRHTGKSNTLVDFVINKYPKDFFDIIVVYCKTVFDDGKWAHILKTIGPEMIRTEFTEESLLLDYLTIESIVSEDPKFRTLIIFDDMIADNISTKVRLNTLAKLAVMGRHKGISVIVTTQLFRALAPALRNNVTNLLVFGTNNGVEAEKIAEENRSALSKKTFYNIMASVFMGGDNRFVDGERPFLHINNAKPLAERFWKGWDTPIYIQECHDMEAQNEGGYSSDESKEESVKKKPRFEEKDEK
jgi:hypothetical protein